MKQEIYTRFIQLNGLSCFIYLVWVIMCFVLVPTPVYNKYIFPGNMVVGVVVIGSRIIVEIIYNLSKRN